MMDGNVYVRAATATAVPLAVWSPAPTDTCMTTASSLDELRKLATAFETNGRYLNLPPGSVFKSPDLGHYEPFRPLPGGTAGPGMPDDVRSLLGWSEQDARTPGAYPLRAEGGTR
jgi:hypothetical protein